MIYNYFMTLEMGRDEDAQPVDINGMNEHERLVISDWAWTDDWVWINRQFIIILKIRINSKERLGKRKSEWQSEWQG